MIGWIDEGVARNPDINRWLMGRHTDWGLVVSQGPHSRRAGAQGLRTNLGIQTQQIGMCRRIPGGSSCQEVYTKVAENTMQSCMACQWVPVLRRPSVIRDRQVFGSSGAEHWR